VRMPARSECELATLVGRSRSAANGHPCSQVVKLGRRVSKRSPCWRKTVSVPTFIVGTGRCGSTMLSNMLREHPRVLNLSEFYAIVTDAGRVPQAFAPEPMEASQFWAMLSACPPRNTFAFRHGVASPELLYPYAAS